MSKALDLARALVNELENEESKSKVMLSEIPVGEKFATDIGKFIVLEQCGESTKVITEELFREDVRFDSDTRNYAESELRKLCDGEIYDEFGAVFGAENIVTHDVDLTSVDMQNEFGYVSCKVRPITFDEARKYNDLIMNNELPNWHWTCTPWSTEERGWKYSVAVVAPSGYFLNRIYCHRYYGVRPVCILKSNIFVSKED